MDRSRSLDLHLRASVKIPSSQSGLQRDPDPPGPFKVFDVKFCPFYTAWPVFAIVGLRHILICRPPTEKEEAVVLLTILCDRGNPPKSGPEPESLNSCEWNFVSQAEPLLSVTGESGLIKVFHALSGDEFTTLVGHGIGTVNDLATHPVHPSILASASMDSSIRIWDLRRCSDKSKFPCIIICGHGQGHKEGILSIAWHEKGKYLVSGGLDQQICVWSIPNLSSNSSFWDKIANPERSAQSVRVIHFPHFISSALHSNYIDCVLFHGDLILSKAAEENKIVLWRICGFNSVMEPPPQDHAVKTREYLDTRSGFLHTSSKSANDLAADKPLYERLLEFSIPNSEYFYMRFSLLEPSLAHPDLHPTLTFGNFRSKVLFWDLFRLEESGHDGFGGDSRAALHDPHTPLKAHLELAITDFPPKKDKSFQARGVSWSPDGRWCVVAGESNLGKEDAVVAIFERRVQAATEDTSGRNGSVSL